MTLDYGIDPTARSGETSFLVHVEIKDHVLVDFPLLVANPRSKFSWTVLHDESARCVRMRNR
jgi:hypothetical protein